MSVYLDASVVVSLLVEDSHADRARRLFASGVDLAVSRWTLAETSSALSLGRRAGILDAVRQDEAERKLDAMTNGAAIEAILQSDFDTARQLVRVHANLRAPDALHLAIAQRTGLPLATFDRRMADAARTSGVEVADI